MLNTQYRTWAQLQLPTQLVWIVNVRNTHLTSRGAPCRESERSTAAAFNSRHFCSPFISELTAAVTESKQDIDVCLFCVIMFMRFNFAENVM